MARINFKTIAKNVDYTTFATYQEMLSYAGGSLSYPGQILGVLQAHDTPDNVTPFILDANKTPVGIASFTKVQEMIEDRIGNMAGALVMQGHAPSTEFNQALTNHTAGWVFVVITAGTYIGQQCNIGDMIICETTGTADNNDDWFVLESNQPNMVTSTSKSVDEDLPVFSGTSGKVIQNSGTNLSSILVSTPNYGLIHPPKGGTSSVQELSEDEISKIKQQLGVGGAASSAAKLATARMIDGVEFDGTGNVTHFCTCSTAAGTAAKTVNLPGFVIAPNQAYTGARISVKFTNGSTAVSPTLSVNGGTAFPISWPGGALASIEEGQVLDMVFQFGSTGGFNVVGSANNPNNVTNASGGATSDGEIPVFSDTTGKAIEGSGVNIENLADKNFVDQMVNGLAPMYHILAVQALQIPFPAESTAENNTITLNLPSIVTASKNAITALKALITSHKCIFFANLAGLSVSMLSNSDAISVTIAEVGTFTNIYYGNPNTSITGAMLKGLINQYGFIALRKFDSSNNLRLCFTDSIKGDGVIYYPGGDTVEFTEG